MGATGPAFPSSYDEAYKKEVLAISRDTMKFEEAEAKEFLLKEIDIDGKKDFIGIKKVKK